MKTNVIVDVFTEKTSISIKDENTYGVEVFAVGDNVMVNVSDTPNEIIVTTDEVVAISLYDEDLFNRTGGVNLGDADTLDGYHAMAFPRKIEKAIITGEWDFTNKIGIKVPVSEAKEADFQNEGSSILQGKVLFGSDLESRDGFVSGFSGSGFRYDYQTGHMTIDNLTVRKMMRVYELLISQIRASNGSIWVSDAAKIKDVVETTLYWRCIIDSDSGSVAIPYRENDLIRCQRWTGKGVKYYSAKVIGIGSDYFDVEKLSIDGLDIPEAGDDTVRIGNTTDTNRQGAIYITSSDDYAPYIDVMDGVNSYDFTGKVKVRLGRLNGISFQGKELEGYGAFMQNAYLTGAAQSANGKWQLNADGSGSLAGGSITWTAEGVMTFTSITDYVTEEIAAFGTMVSESLALFQSQIDQKAEYWFQENDPSVNWTTENTKAAHVGDRWYKASTREAWTWNGATWDAVGVTDPIYAAMVNANEAQDTADGKRTVFVAQPYTPYKIGDLWLKEEGGKPGEILRCQTEKGDTESFSVADWILASKYTDDTTANKKSKTYIGGTWATRPDQYPTQWTDAEIINNIGDVWLRDDTRLNPATGLEETTQVAMRWTGLAWMDDATSIDGGRINTASIKAGSIDVDTLLANRILLKSEGSAIGGFDIQATSLKLGTQATHHPAENQEGIWMGKVPEDYGDGLPRYKFFVGNALQNILFNGENLFISGQALLGDESDSLPIGNLGVLSKWFTVMNPGLANEYLKVNGSVAATGEVSAYRGEEGVFPPSLWEAMPLAGATIVGGIKIGSGFNYVDGVLSVAAQSGTIQTLSLNGTTLSISGGNSVTIPATYTDVMARAACALSGTVYDSARLSGVVASSYTRRDVAESISQPWIWNNDVSALRYNNGVFYGTNPNNARNHFTQYNYSSAAINAGWIAAAFGDNTGDRFVVGAASGKAIIGAHNGNLDAWADLSVNYGGGKIGLGRIPAYYNVEIMGAVGIGQFSNGTAVIDASNGNAYFGTNTYDNGIYITTAGLMVAKDGIVIKSNDCAVAAPALTMRSRYNGYDWPDARIVCDYYGGLVANSGVIHGMHFISGRENYFSNFIFRNQTGTQLCLIDHTGTLTATADIIATNKVTSGNGANGGFTNAIYVAGANRIWSFGNAVDYGIYYNQGGIDYIYMPFGSHTSPKFKFDMYGNFTATGEVTAYAASDKHLKTNIRTITNAGAILRQLRAVEYDWNETAMCLNPAKRDAPHSVSFIAQEWEKVLPWATHSIFGKYKSIDDKVMHGYLVAGWNEHDKMLTGHDKEIKQLRQRVSELEKQLNKP